MSGNKLAVIRGKCCIYIYYVIGPGCKVEWHTVFPELQS